MTISFNDVCGFNLANENEDLGVVSDFYFDDQVWAGRYLVIETGSWLSSNKILVSLADIVSVSVESMTLKTALSKTDIKQAPPVAMQPPVSEQQRQQWHLKANVSTYLAGAVGSIMPALMYLHQHRSPETVATTDVDAADQDRHLRSAQEVIGYTVADSSAQDLGSVTDIILHDNAKKIEYVVIDTGGWLPGQLVVIAPQWCEEISWADRSIKLAMPKDKIENAPSLFSLKDLHRSYHESIHAYYGYPLV